MSQQPLLFGKYKLLELVARGGMAEVFKAKSFGAEGFEKLVVIKRILPELAQNQLFVEMCINEAKLAVALNHANIVQVFDLGREEDTYFIVMEYVNGMDFGDVIRRCRRTGVALPTELALFVACETARALDYAHRRRDSMLRPLNIVHRDVSPQNILLSFEGEVKVTDFGIAKARNTTDSDGSVKGKYAYMAPEQAKGLEVDARADVFALGVVLFESLTGVNPFLAETPYETLRRVQNGERARLRSVAPSLDDELAGIVEQALCVDPARRYNSAARLYEDISGYLYGTGKRVSGHDLAEWLQVLRDAPSIETPPEYTTPKPSDSAPKTPVQIPSRSGRRMVSPNTVTGRNKPHAERRDATFLSVWVTQSSSLDEDVLQTLVSIASRHGGAEIARSVQDIQFIFGVRAPDGHDTEYAAHCALTFHRLLRALTPDSEVSVAIHATRVNLRSDGECEQDRWFVGARALARELTQAARSSVVASEAAARMLMEHFHLRPWSGSDAALDSGAGIPMVIDGERSADDPVQGRFVGRKEQLRKLGEVLARAERNSTRSVTLVGDPGAGKSRTLAEARYRLRRRSHSVAWYGVTCLTQERDVPFSAFQSMLRVILGVDEADSRPLVERKARRLRDLGLAPDDVALLSSLLGVAGTYESREPAGLHQVWFRASQQLSRDQLTVFAWDAAENMDDESQSLVSDLMRRAGRGRVVIIVSCRPGYQYAWKDATELETIDIGPLNDDESLQLITRRLGLDPDQSVPNLLRADLLGKSAGNPLFIEQYLQLLVDAGSIENTPAGVTYKPEANESGVPKTLRGMIASQIARLEPAHRHVLQVASVVGSRFNLNLLSEILDIHRERIDERIERLVERGVVSVTGTEEASFVREVVREAIYDGLPLEVRRELHATVAAAIERRFPERAEEWAERLAAHFRETSDPVRAVEYLVRASKRQEGEWAHAAAIQNLSTAIEIVLNQADPDADVLVQLYERLGAIALRGRQVALGIDRLAQGIDLSDRATDQPRITRLHLLMGRLLALANRVSEAESAFENARDRAEQLGDLAMTGEILTALGETLTRNGEFGRGRPHLERAVQLALQRSDVRDAFQAMLFLARCESAEGERDTALSTVARAAEFGRELHDPVAQIDLEKSIAHVHFMTRDFQQSTVHSERALELAREYNLPYEITANSHNSGDAWLRLGDYKRAFTMLKMSLDVARENGFEKMTHLNNVFLAFIDAARFGSAEGHAMVVDALRNAEDRGYTWDVLHMKYLLGILARESGDRTAAVRLLSEALTLARETRNALYIDDCEMLLSELEDNSSGGRPSV